MDRTTQIPLNAEELNEANLTGIAVHGPDHERIGSISHLHGLGRSTQAVIDVGGFLGIGSKPVLVQLSALNIVRGADGTVFALSNWTADDLKAMPDHRG